MNLKRTMMSLALPLSFLCQAVAGFDTANVDATLIDAVALYNDGRISEARTRLRQIVDSFPDNDAALYYLGTCEFAEGALESAEVHLRRAVESDSLNYWYKDRLAQLYSATQRPELTTRIYESLLKDFPRKTDIYYSLVNLYGQQGKVDKVLSMLDEIDAVNGRSEMVTLARYDVLRQMKKNDEAFAALKAYNDEFASARVLSVMGDTFLEQYKDSLALGYYEEALSEDPSFPSALVGKAEVLRIRRDFNGFFDTMQLFFADGQIGQGEKTRYITTLLQQADPRFVQNFRTQMDSLVTTYVACAPGDSSTVQAAGTYYYATSRPVEAGVFFRRNRDNFPESLSARMLYLQYLGYMQQWQSLVDEAESCFRTFPTEIGFLEMKTAAYFNLKDYRSVISENERIITVAHGDSAAVLSAYAGIGDMYSQLGDNRKAYKAYDAALKINPRYAPVLNNYAYYLCLEKRKLSKAYQMSKITITDEPDNATYLDTFGWILYSQGKPLEAKAYFKHAMLYGGKEQASVLDHYAEVLYALKEYDVARFYWDQAKARNNNGEIPDLEERVKARFESLKK